MSTLPRLPYLVALLIGLTTFVSAPARAADVPRAARGGDIDQLRTDGWVETTNGIYQRTVDGRLQILAYGDAGPRVELGWIDTQIGLLTESLAESGSAEVALTLQELEQRRDALRDALREGVRRRSIGETSLAGQSTSGFDQAVCDPQATATANATAGPTGGGPQAAASTSYGDSCGQSASVYCYAFARGYQGTVYNDGTQADGPRTVNGSGSCSVSKTVQADNNCFATSTAQVDFTDDAGNPVTFFERSSTVECEAYTVEITSGDHYTLILPYGKCLTETFTAGSNRSDTTFEWSFDGMASGTGSSFTRQFCNFDPYATYTWTHTLGLTGTSGTDTATDSAVIDVEYHADPKCGPGISCDD